MSNSAMSIGESCPRCGGERPASAPAGLCPRCLLRIGLGAGLLQGASRDVPRPRRITSAMGGSCGDGEQSRTSGILSALDASVGPVPRVLLRESTVDLVRPARTGSEEMPTRAGDAGRYHLFGEIARGGMGVVLRGRDVDLGRDVAVKVLRERHRECPEMVRRFVEEAQIGGQLQHPGIVPVYELGQLPDERLYIAMKLVKGRTLAALVEARGSAADDVPRFLAIFEQVCQTMAYAHSCGVIHRDLKPSNVMVGSFGEVQVMDWGLAKVVDQGGVADDERSLRSWDESGVIRTVRSGSEADESHAGSVLGTPAYMAPEQARGLLDTLDERADVFGLGAILCEILTGQPPYTGSTVDDLYRRAERADLADASARLDHSGADGELVALARSCLAAAPRDRPRDAGVVAAALTAHLAGAQARLRLAELARARAESRAAEERHRRVLAVGLAASLTAVAALALGGGAWVARDRETRRQAIAREVTGTLHAATLLLGQARSASERELSRWAEATQAARRAEALLTRGEIGPDLRRQVRDLVTTIARERLQAEAKSKDRRVVDRLAEIHADMAVHFDRDQSDRAFAEAFKDYGININRLEPADAGARIAAAPVAVDLVNAIDQWTFLRRTFGPGEREGVRRLVDIAKAADPDPWRCRLRDALNTESKNPALARAEFEQLAETADGDDPHSESLSRLAFVLGHIGDEERAVSLLHRVQRAHPDDFWINCDLASNLMRAGRPEEAIRFYSVAVAIRPRSEFALRELGRALREAGRGDEAASYPGPWPGRRDAPRRFGPSSAPAPVAQPTP